MNNTLSEQEKIFRLAFHISKGIGPAAFVEVINAYSTIEAFLDVNETLVEPFKKIASSLRDGLSKIDQFLQDLNSKGIKYAVIGDGTYPSRLAEIYSPPIALFYKGSIDLSELSKYDNLVAVVGSRSMDNYGRILTERLVSKVLLSSKSTMFISGMAFGVDIAVHDSCFSAGLPSVAVLASGVDIASPASNWHIYNKTLENGLVVSEYVPGTKPQPGFFPHRNRIISGLSKMVVVVQAEKESGTLVTARLAVEQDRQLFAIPGSIDDKLFAGCNFLIKNNMAEIVLSIDDFVSENFSIDLSNKDVRAVDTSLIGVEQCVYSSIIEGSLPALMLRGEFGESEIYDAIFSLEMKGLISSYGGNYLVSR